MFIKNSPVCISLNYMIHLLLYLLCFTAVEFHNEECNLLREQC